MGFYDDEETALQYIAMAEGYDGRELIEVLRNHLQDGSSVLELGMGPGVDLTMLENHYLATGSDISQYFLDRYRDSNADADLMFLDAVELETERKFDCIYSNKVLHHLANDQLALSLHRQIDCLTDGGLVFHSFWRGEGVEEHHGLKFVYQSEDSLREIFGVSFGKVEVVSYTEMESDDSLYVVARV